MTSLLLTPSQMHQEENTGEALELELFDSDAVDFEPLLVTGSELHVLIYISYYVVVRLTHRLSFNA